MLFGERKYRTRDKKFTKLQTVDKNNPRQKKGSSFGITAAASRGVFYELLVGRGKSTNGFTCTSSSARAEIVLPTCRLRRVGP